MNLCMTLGRNAGCHSTNHLPLLHHSEPGSLVRVVLVMQAMFHQANMGTAGGTTKSLLQRWVW
jgi:hypothetical protein